MTTTTLSTTLLRLIDRSRQSQIWPGFLIALALGAVAVFMSRGLGGVFAQSPLLVAILIGLLIGNSFGSPESLHPGLTFVVKRLLRVAVALVGFRITFQQVGEIGIVPFLIAAAVLTATFLFTVWMSRRFFGVEREMSYLLAAGCSVCGAAAILAVAAVVKSRPKEATIAVTLITLLGTLTLLAYPVAFATSHLPGLNETTYGVFVGATVFEVAQVVGAGYTVSDVAGNTAIVVKLSKVLMLVPLLIILGIRMRREEAWSEGQEIDAGPKAAPPLIPWFVIGFILVVCLNTLQLLPKAAVSAINEGNLFLLTMVMVALGLQTQVTRFQELRWAIRPTLASLVTFVFVAGFGFGLVSLATPVLAGGSIYAPPDLPAGSPLAEGERLFSDIGCAKCHTPSLTVDQQQLYLYSDLLLHDMGPALDDKVVQGQAGGSDWRTTPLWGLGLRTRYLHDGRATTLRQAIVAHGGEAKIVIGRFLELGEAEQAALFEFLNSR